MRLIFHLISNLYSDHINNHRTVVIIYLASSLKISLPKGVIGLIVGFLQK